jgi:hypothetical protein
MYHSKITSPLGCTNRGSQTSQTTVFFTVMLEHLWVLGIELAARHSSEAQNFETAPRSFGKRFNLSFTV